MKKRTPRPRKRPANSGRAKPSPRSGPSRKGSARTTTRAGKRSAATKKRSGKAAATSRRPAAKAGRHAKPRPRVPVGPEETGRLTQLPEEMERHHETSPTLTGGDIDADWMRGEGDGEETVGGTPTVS